MLRMFSKFHTYTFGEFFEICFEYSFRKNIFHCFGLYADTFAGHEEYIVFGDRR